MKVIEQRSNEWFEQRKGKVTASVAGAALGLNPYMSCDDALRAMVRDWFGAEKEFIGNVATEWGNSMESYATGDLELDQGIGIEITGLHVSKEHDWLAASPDGLVGSSHVVEIKCPYSLRNKDKPEFKTIRQQMQYYAQVQMQLYCTDRNKAFFYQWAPRDSVLEIVERDDVFIDNMLIELKKFYMFFLREVELGEDSSYMQPKINIINNNVLLKKYNAAKENLEAAETALKEIKVQMIDAANGKKSKLGDVNIYSSVRKGAVNYKKIIKELELEVDFDRFRGAETSYWTVK